MARKKRTPHELDPDIAQAVEHLSPADHQTLLGYAAQRVHVLERTGHPVSGDEAHILVHDAIVDTLTGVARWNRCQDLRFHLCSVIRAATSHVWRRAQKIEHVSLDDASDDSALAERARAAAAQGDRAPADDRLHAKQVYSLVSKRAANDNEVLALVAAYRDGADKRVDVVDARTLSRTQYLNARRRLDRILATVLDEQERPPADDGIGNREAAGARPARPANDEVRRASTCSQDPMKSGSTRRSTKPKTARTASLSTRMHTPPPPAPKPALRACAAAGPRLALFQHTIETTQPDEVDDFDDQDTLVVPSPPFRDGAQPRPAADTRGANLEDTLELDDDERTGRV